jgi:hypothetical protein
MEGDTVSIARKGSSHGDGNEDDDARRDPCDVLTWRIRYATSTGEVVSKDVPPSVPRLCPCSGPTAGKVWENPGPMCPASRGLRRRPPSRKHAFFAALAEPSRRPVKVLAAQLRLADALDRSHRQVVRKLEVTMRAHALLVILEADSDFELELWRAERRKALLESVLGRSASRRARRRTPRRWRGNGRGRP